MNTLNKHRILQKGDEYYDGATWKPVPSLDFGMQIMFSDYKEVRRPSEEPPRKPEQSSDNMSPEAHPKNLNAAPVLAETRPTLPLAKATQGDAQEATKHKVPPAGKQDSCGGVQPIKAKLISPKQASDKIATPVAAEGDSDPALSHSGAGKRPIPIYDSSYLEYPKNSDCIWTGRNGTFNGYALDVMRMDDKVMLIPIGKRGAGNCTIQFPTAIIPQLVDWLLKTSKNKKPKMRQIDNMTPAEIDTLKIKGMIAKTAAASPEAPQPQEHTTFNLACPRNQDATWTCTCDESAAAPEAPQGATILELMRKHVRRTWGAFDESGKLRATFDSESEARFYVQGRGHMHNGSYRQIASAEQLAEALRKLVEY